jgi:glycerol kinase
MTALLHAHYLVIDQGGHGTRALVFDGQGKTVVSAHAPLETRHPQAGWFEQDAGLLELSVQSCLQQLEKQVLEKNLAILSAALITQRSSLLAWDKETRQALTPVISWQDTRHHDWLQKKIEHGDWDVMALKKCTGLRLNAHYGASKMRWLLDHDPAVQHAARQQRLFFLPLAAYVTHLLTANPVPVVDAGSASRTFLTELGGTDWSPYLLSLFQIDQSQLPPMVNTRHHFGHLALAGQQIPLEVVGGDQSFIPFAYGDQARDNSLFINAGTGAFVQTSLSPDETPTGLLCSMAAIDAQQSLTVAEGTVNACASALDWLEEQEQQRLLFDEVEQALLAVSMPPVFHHRITALGSPYWLPAGESFFSAAATLPEKTVAVIESIVFLLAINMDLLQLAKPGLQHILISGGMAQSDGFCQKLANTSRMKVMRHHDHEASARGAAFYLAKCPDYLPDQKPDLFQPRQDSTLLARYQIFYEQLRQEWLSHQ